MEALYKLYKLSNLAFKYYIEDTKRGKNCTKECVERKILCMMLVAPIVKDNEVGCKRYQFGTFNILIREDSDEIGMVYWSQKSVFISSETSQHLKNLYKFLGLSEDGQEIVGEIDEQSLNTYLAENNLTNIGTFKNHFKTDISFLKEESVDA